MMRDGRGRTSPSPRPKLPHVTMDVRSVGLGAGQGINRARGTLGLTFTRGVERARDTAVWQTGQYPSLTPQSRGGL